MHVIKGIVQGEERTSVAILSFLLLVVIMFEY
jgi:hypothetical protein